MTSRSGHGAGHQSRVARTLLAVVGFYQRAISPALPPRCRFTPSCSAYAVEAIEVHGAGRGSWLAVRRLAKCAPWHPGGVDLVPPRRSGTTGSPGSADPDPGPAPAADPGTAGSAHSSCTAAPPPAPVPPGAGRTDSAPRPAPGRTPPQEARVA